MSIFQLLLLIVAGTLFYLFFKQIMSGNHPKRGVDFEASKADGQIGGISRPDKTFSTPHAEPTRMETLFQMADDAVAKGDMLEAKKALQSALIIEPENIEALQRIGYVYLQIKSYEDAKESYGKILSLDENDDLAHASLANVLHKIGGREEEALIHHQRAIQLDVSYAPHYFNYANTLYDLGRKEEALEAYKKAYELDGALQEAKEMIDQLSGGKNE
ncbi:MAG: tetratricopeptide repeat protein [Campylobacterales bacterium]|nr:tetratricopeptide repeat protein [Campylobacterales bacterium]